MQMISAHTPVFAIGDSLRSHMHQVDQLGKVIGCAGFAVLLITLNRQIICANDAAETLLAENNLLRQKHGCLNLEDAIAARKLRALLAPASSPRGEGSPKGSIVLYDKCGYSSLIIHVVPLGRNEEHRSHDEDEAAAGLFIVDCRRGTTERIRAFADLFALTPAEAKVLAQLISGDGLKISAHRLNIAQSTARTHLAHILEKTGVHRQAELVRVFFETTIPWEEYRSATALRRAPLGAATARRNEENAGPHSDRFPATAAVML
ncbi:helix-turn-helix transcriptional regulator [Methylocapsa palsarum]|uniref:Regulatory protein, luxR family n=1 Tax=Methylocapsa palsarum TaxID=1612308 RepID=A0A1I3YEX2_9HYPH|nr:helix-turn-helix transcriptional regulator [Methylocapsa palsarum]SFK29746.1 regulatory protein, luxR family [Methylocapsa palsarum]